MPPPTPHARLLLLHKSHESKAHLAVSCRCDWIGAWSIHFIERGTLGVKVKHGVQSSVLMEIVRCLAPGADRIHELYLLVHRVKTQSHDQGSFSLC